MGCCFDFDLPILWPNIKLEMEYMRREFLHLKAQTHGATFHETFAKTSRATQCCSVCPPVLMFRETLRKTVSEVGSSSSSETIQNCCAQRCTRCFRGRHMVQQCCTRCFSKCFKKCCTVCPSLKAVSLGNLLIHSFLAPFVAKRTIISGKSNIFLIQAHTWHIRFFSV